ncbi:MAG: hypothetical protein KGJ23_01315 [Euryarchaeota archaeon]|nr:hypothetical protein [Euryarchaeota archaeon]MDE1835237.1 hypothetical protein [Euryarchaeota archaeon]MDE1881040.1 hypothetical protein [Euryarchaeota archaeon]MDE2043533.1 hypothetical protein [Thermoplasmata archaeon]
MPASKGSVSREEPRPLNIDTRLVSPVLRELARGLADARPRGPLREELESVVARMVGTAGDGKDLERSRRSLDWLVRVHTPEWVELAGLVGEGRRLRKLAAVITDLPATTAQAALLRTLEAVQADGVRASEQLRSSLEGASGPEGASTAWSRAVDLVEEVVKSPERTACGLAAASGAQIVAKDLSIKAGWNVAMSVADLAAQSAAWRSSEPRVAACVSAFLEGEDWNGIAMEARDAALESLTPSMNALGRSFLDLLSQMIQPP